MLRGVLTRCHGNVSEAARQLKVDRTTVHRRMRRYGILAHSDRRPLSRDGR